MKIALIGTHEVGKTTLLNSLEPNFTEFHFIPEIIQDFHFQTRSFFEYMSIQEEVLKKQIVLETLKENTISDRSSIDNLAYMIVEFMDKFPQYDMEMALKKIHNLSLSVISSTIANFKTYDILFYVPVEFLSRTPTKTELIYQRNVDEVIKFLIKIYKLEIFYVTGTVEERKENIIKIYNQVIENETW